MLPKSFKRDLGSERKRVRVGRRYLLGNAGTPPDAVADTAMSAPRSKNAHGFFEAWTPIINGQFFTDVESVFKSTDAGYEIVEKPPSKDTDTLFLDKDLLLHHVTSVSAKGNN